MTKMLSARLDRDFTHVIFRYIAGLYPNAPFETRNRVKGCSESIKTSSFDVTYAPIYDCCREFTGLSSFLYV